jgi:hypothetical protein
MGTGMGTGELATTNGAGSQKASTMPHVLPHITIANTSAMPMASMRIHSVLKQISV